MGQQSSWDRNGQQWQSTVAVLGADRVANNRNSIAEELAELREGFEAVVNVPDRAPAVPRAHVAIPVAPGFMLVAFGSTRPRFRSLVLAPSRLRIQRHAVHGANVRPRAPRAVREDGEAWADFPPDDFTLIVELWLKDEVYPGLVREPYDDRARAVWSWAPTDLSADGSGGSSGRGPGRSGPADSARSLPRDRAAGRLRDAPANRPNRPIRTTVAPTPAPTPAHPGPLKGRLRYSVGGLWQDEGGPVVPVFVTSWRRSRRGRMANGQR